MSSRVRAPRHLRFGGVCRAGAMPILGGSGGRSEFCFDEIVVNGGKEVLGSDSRAVQEAIRTAAKEPHAEVAIAMTSPEMVSFRVAKLPPGSHEADILLGVTESGLMTPVLGGENSGHQLRHAGVVRSLTSVGRLDPKKPGEYTATAQLNLRADWNRSNLKLVLFVQDRNTRRILGAASVKP